MSDDIKTVEDKNKKSETGYTPEQFVKDYQILCEKMCWQIVISPAFAATNHGTFEVVLQTSVGKLPKKDKFA